MQIDNETIKKINDIYKKLDECNNDLCLEEVLADRKLTAKIEQEKNDLQAVVDAYEDYVKLQKEFDTEKSNENEIALQKAITNLNLAMTTKNNEDKIEVEMIFKNSSQKLADDILTGYENYCGNNNFSFEILSKDSNNFKLSICGNACFEIFCYENGIHKSENQIVSITSYPAIKKEEPEFGEQDIKIDIFRSNGAGGQNVNKVSTAIRITHIKTGIVATCQDERSQFQNRERALKNLKEKVNNYFNKKYIEELSKQKKQYTSKEIVKTYDYEKNIITNTKTKQKFNLNSFVEGKII